MLALGLAVLLTAAPDGGVRAPKPAPVTTPARSAQAGPLSAQECERLIDTIVVRSVTETMAKDAEASSLAPEQRAAVLKLARRQALAEPDLEQLKRKCPERYTRAQERCILAAATMNEIDACTR